MQDRNDLKTSKIYKWQTTKVFLFWSNLEKCDKFCGESPRYKFETKEGTLF